MIEITMIIVPIIYFLFPVHVILSGEETLSAVILHTFESTSVVEVRFPDLNCPRSQEFVLTVKIPKGFGIQKRGLNNIFIVELPTENTALISGNLRCGSAEADLPETSFPTGKSSELEAIGHKFHFFKFKKNLP